MLSLLQNSKQPKEEPFPYVIIENALPETNEFGKIIYENDKIQKRISPIEIETKIYPLNSYHFIEEDGVNKLQENARDLMPILGAKYLNFDSEMNLHFTCRACLNRCERN